ncbi:PREDICTED: pentatricopeptide repeat-containing protein At3g60960, mitochondrial-like [Camelina sativa]|uniref:Pentatricopeptide repeat-containing protein At3g60960, mitochondrial-like n=1 Tax=Camelina sativa TaxID=90675 RepID=A0ABM0X4F5_CAMSA|nr:PREDICTED: pentatricopeptide repeat-containing protein At3g60960, mitochondrial-like [Camelina sativa]
MPEESTKLTVSSSAGLRTLSLFEGFLAHGNIDKASKIFKDLKQGHETYPYYGAEYIEMSQVAYMNMEHFFKQGKDEEAMQWYRSTISKYCLKQGKDDEQGTVDNRIPKNWENRADTVNSVLKVLLKYGKKTEAWSLFDKLCEINKAVEIARTKEAWDGNADCYTTLVTRFVRQGMMSEADVMFNEMFSSVHFPMYRYLGIHRVMVDGFVKAGRFDDAHRFVNKIADISLNHVSRRVDFSLSTGHGFFI